MQYKEQYKMRYKPLQGHHLVSFILLRDFEQVALTVKQQIPAACWSQVQLWHSYDGAGNADTGNDEANGSQYWIEFQPPVRLNCQTIKGQPFIARGVHFQAGEVIESEIAIAAIATKEPCLLWLEFGQLKIKKKSALSPVDCHYLLKPCQPVILPLWTPTIATTETASAIQETTYAYRDAHSMLALEQLKTAAPTKFLNAMLGKEETARSHRSPRRNQPFWQRLFSVFGYRGKRSTAGASGQGAASANRSRSPHSQKQPAPFFQNPFSQNPFFQRLSEYWRERVMRSHLGGLIGKRQAQYFHDMMQQFNSGDLFEALKMAVPLSDYREALNHRLEQKSLPSLGLPGKRRNLNISLTSPRTRRGYGFAEESYAQMRSLYEKAYQQLKADEQHKEAAFVLAELLNRIDEAVDYLTQKGFLAEAAEISENRTARIDKTIKLWIQAGDSERAIALAIRSNKFKAALLLLKGNKQALPLESLWIKRLIDSGDFETLFSYYADNIYPHTTPTLRLNRLTEFFENILPQDALKEPVWLARYICTQPWHTVETELMAFFQAPWSPNFTQFWSTFSALTHRHKDWKAGLKSLVFQPLLKEWYRQATMYYGRPSVAASNRQLTFLSAHITDRLFRQCRPKKFNNAFVVLPEQAAGQGLGQGLGQATEQTPTFQFSASEDLITDVAITATGQVCIAMGALGLRIYDRQGACSKQLPTPAHRLVSPMAGTTVIAVEHREKLNPVHRVQLHTQTVSFMGQQPITVYGRQHNGATWPIEMGNRIYLVDVVAAEWTHRWRTGNLEGIVRQVVSNAEQLTFLLDNEGQLTPWQYRLPTLRLASRASIESINAAPQSLSKLSLGTQGEIVGISPLIDANKQTKGIEFYRSSSLKSYQRIGQITQEGQDTQPLTQNLRTETVKVIYSNASILIVAIKQSSQQQLIHTYKIRKSNMVLLFSIESSLQPLAVQVNKTWIVIGQGDQFLVYQVSGGYSCLVRIS